MLTMSTTMPKQPGTMLTIVSMAVCLGVHLMIISAHIIGFSLQSPQALTKVPKKLINADQDLLSVMAWTVIFVVLL